MSNLLELAYNTEAPKMVIPEYGRNVQKMIDHAITLTDKEERNKCAKAIVQVMKQINQHIKDQEDVNQKLWSHLFIMSNFKFISVESFKQLPLLFEKNLNYYLFSFLSYLTRVFIPDYFRMKSKWIRFSKEVMLLSVGKK